ncbi:putative Fanconi-associated nuclease 1 like protein [Glarea lozoyensis 74030]|uniref:Fanconi-associated nuclease n=1 Tax=Glarea lozoyensis (strain ATCC 74030 / MF5533) TaxID=1104152 RepID=H0ECY9_GLAL7|nr:putative Fanconi-associated nuclease 1 like protein [Glarea lozoyensis 74030]
MVLTKQRTAVHNSMLGRRIPHPSSTNFTDDSPPSKRLKTHESTDDDFRDVSPLRTPRAETPDSDDECSSGEVGASNVHVTELESALGPVKTDKEAIQEYEAMRAAEGSLDESEDVPGAGDLNDRLSKRSWTRGKSSIYVDAFNLALETVLEDEGHLFDEREMKVFQIWRELDYEAQYLLPETTAEIQVNPAEHAPPDGTVLDSTFTFADSSDGMITSLEEASSLLNLEELKVIGKESKLRGKNKTELLNSLRSMSRRQSGLGWVGLKRSDSEQTSVSDSGENDDTGAEDDGMSDSNPRISRRNFPDYIVSRSANIFTSRAELLEFEAGLRTQFRVEDILEMNGNPGKAGLEEVKAIFDEVYPRWKVLLEEEQRKEERVYESGEGAYLRRFSPAWVYTRIVHKGTYVLGRFKLHAEEHEVLSKLLGQHLFHAARRGAWYQRKALLEEHYMYAIAPPENLSDPEKHKRHWKRIALQTCEQGLQDKDCHIIYHYDLQKRIKKIEKNIKMPMREQHDFDHVLLAKPIEVTVEGIQIKKNYPPSLKRRTSNTHPPEEKLRSTKTIWVDEAETGGECSVEAMCLSHYRSQGFKGYHAEGGIIRTLFAYLFFDILFIYIPNVFQTAYQTCPLDLHTDAFFPSRISEINHRLVEIANGNAADIIRSVDSRERERATCVIGLRWDFELDDLLEIVACFPDEALAAVCKVMAQEYRVRGGGIPDLFIWKPATGEEKGEVRFVEVKIIERV